MALVVTPLAGADSAPTPQQLEALREAQEQEQAGQTSEQEAPEQEAQPAASQQAQAPEGQEPSGEGEPNAEPDEAARRENARVAYSLRQREVQLREREARLAAEERARTEAQAKREQEEKELAALDELSLLERIAKKTGKPLETVLRNAIARAANGGKPTPEMEAQAEKDRLAQLEAKQKELDEKLLKSEQDRQAREAQARYEQTLADIRDEYATAIDASLHPFLAALEPSEAVHKAMLIANEYATRTGQLPETNDLMEYVETQEREAFEARAAKVGYARAAKENPEGAAAAAAAATPPPPVAAALPTKGAKKVVSNRAAAARGTPPVDYRKMSERDRVAAAGREVFGKFFPEE